MSEPSILSENQKKLLGLLSQEKAIGDYFYLTGGTALAEFYLHHRLSEDLDFFSEREFDPSSISVLLKKMQAKAGITHTEYQQSFNRNLYFLQIGADVIKAEFTFFPFTRIERKKTISHLFIDSLIDIATNKMFTIYQNPRSRDFIDLYLILKHHPDLTIDNLIENAQMKFDVTFDPIQLGSQYVKVGELKDYPRLITKLDESVWQKYFIEEAKKLSDQIFK